jgi:hypothetical protein
MDPACLSKKRGLVETMDVHIETELQGELLLVTLTGRVNDESLLRLFKEFLDLAAEKRVRKILIDSLAISGILSTMERYDLGTKIAEYVFQLGINPRIAVVGIPPTVDGFVARVAQNRDVAMEVFPTCEKALAWLEMWRI